MRTLACLLTVVAMAVGCGDNNLPPTRDNGLLVITAEQDLETTEAGGTATFQVALNAPPYGRTLTVDLASLDLTEGTVSPASIEFTHANWQTPVTVTVTGVDDDLDDGSKGYPVTVTADKFGNGNVMVSNIDDDTAGVIVTASPGLQTSEAGTTATFTVKLTAEPSGYTAISVVSSDTSEGTVPANATLMFNGDNWNAEQTVTITGVDDAVADGDQDYSIILGATFSEDPAYSNLNPDDVMVKNLDNDVANFLVDPVAGLETTEGQGTATFTVRLLSQPSADVTVSVSSSDATEGAVSPATLTFTTANWNAPQTVTATGVDDAINDGPVSWVAVIDNVVTTDAAYAARNPADVALTNLDNDTAGVQVTVVTPAVTTESGGTAEFDVVLLAQPAGDVTFPVTSGDVSEGLASVTSLTFTAANWNAPQRVTVTGQEDAIDDGDQTYVVVIDADPTYTDFLGAVVEPDDVSLTNLDNDGAGILLSRTSGLETDESGQSDTFTIVLLSQPTADVTISFSSSDATEGSVSPASPIVFTPTDWDQPRTISAVGVDDPMLDGDQPYTIDLTAASSDAGYDGFPIDSVSVTNLDNDSAAIRVTPLQLDVSEFGDFDTFEVVLVTQPSADVTIPLSITVGGVADATEVEIDVNSLTFTPANWNVPQIVTVTGLDDAVVDGQQVALVRTDAAVSTDPAYAGANADDVAVTNFDDESPGVYVQARGLLKTQEGQNQPAFIRMRLTLAPTAPVTCTVTVSDPTEISIDPSPTVFMFDATNFDQTQTITVRGVDDDIVDGDQLATVITALCTSADPVYNLFNPRDIRVLNRDND